ncbi:Vesicular-fusion protein sec18 [Schizosaccharomyces pombe]|uniref:Vesicular-fusion protein sec18 n=1 Tax=Schizosaccharomyces pombe (strain 972 / ATCC 24843) TaxID=284812 RepID=SEC18_SCHPO|nr:putative secretory pathway protein Sec18 [Schizosaccharomyces pombe]Q9P7Q4.1 RecName: Full=Vesicular-fusion protein sec18 [Schizosaccharomyces pombe 972h-]CAB75779.1 secretory pathway protein Sec18 (predicted) [Schizosaccharomyces pombe]|eukprot:NP_594690.1 putative secretory pathway protein Sec18 [Schizosaccharomyces pombe]
MDSRWKLPFMSNKGTPEQPMRKPLSGSYSHNSAGPTPNMSPFEQKPPLPTHMDVRRPSGPFRIVKATSTEDALTNCIIVSPMDFKQQYIIVDNSRVFSTKPVPGFPQGCLGASQPHREWASWSLNQQVHVADYDPYGPHGAPYLHSMTLEVDFQNRNRTTNEPFDGEEMAKLFCSSYQSQVFSPGQKIVFDFRSYNIKATVRTISCVDLLIGENQDAENTADTSKRGLLTSQTEIQFFKAAHSALRLKASMTRPASNAILQPGFKFEDMGIGGLDSEFSAIFRRAFASRLFPPGMVEKLGINHVKGILLYGPPGTGKTLIARQIGKMLNAREPKIVNGPEILNKYVGQSEENVRKLFADAEREYRDRGEESGLHIIIFDELDAICKKRGSSGGDTGVGDQVVNQLLAKMDGVDQLNNILVIGMTNRKDMIDEALLRPGRLEVHMEISLPDEHGRLQILKIHTSRMASNGILENDVDMEELASLTKNFSGAEIAGLIKSASSFAFYRHIKVGTTAAVSGNLENIKVNRNDFLNALSEVRPAYGVSEEELESRVQGGIINFGKHIEEIITEGKLFVQQVKNSERTRLVSVLLSGPIASGKTALAATIALGSEFPFVKLVSAESMVGMNENARVAHVNRVFEDSYKSPLSVIVVDEIERIIDWVPIGPRFSNTLLQTLMVLFKKQPPKGHRLLILATTSERTMLSRMDMTQSFDAEIAVPNVSNVTELDRIIQSIDSFADSNVRADTLQRLQNFTGTDAVNVGVAKILMIAETAKQDVDVVSCFVEAMARAIPME